METKYFLPINSTSLAHYFGCACIKPGKYFNNKQEDIQDKFNEFLLITTHFGTQQTDCCLELVITKQETEDLIDIKNGWFLFEKPLPITRVKKIYFTDKKRKEQTITNINMSTAFVPNDLIEVVKSFHTTQIDKIKQPIDIHINSYVNKLKSFDSFLGGLALMRLAGEEYMNYSENYFATLSFFNENIQKDLEFSKITIDTRYQGVFTGNNGFDKIIPYLSKTIDENDVNSIAQEEKQTIQKDKITRIIDLSSLDKWTYTIAVLNTYGAGTESKKKKVDELILSNFKSDIKAGKSEGIALCYGINRGYSVFSNKYNLGRTEKIVKFQLNSQLDYYSIESLYQYTFNQTKSNNFPYLDNWCPKLKWPKISKKTDYKILDVLVIGKKPPKPLSKEWWAEKLPFFLQSNKLIEKTLPQIFQELGETIYEDVKNELEEDYESKIAFERAEKETLKNELVSERKKVVELQKNTPSIKEYSLQTNETKSVVSEPVVSQQTQQDIKFLVEQYLKYKAKGKKLLEKEAEVKGLNVKGKKVEEIIVLLMTTKDKDLFNG